MIGPNHDADRLLAHALVGCFNLLGRKRDIRSSLAALQDQQQQGQEQRESCGFERDPWMQTARHRFSYPFRPNGFGSGEEEGEPSNRKCPDKDS